MVFLTLNLLSVVIITVFDTTIQIESDSCITNIQDVSTTVLKIKEVDKEIQTNKSVSVQKATTTKEEIESVTTVESTQKVYSASEFRNIGVLYWGGWKWTWYSERVLRGEGLNIPGRHTDDDGYICDEDDYICLASSALEKGDILDTPLGKQGKIYDCGCASNTIDVYVNW